MMLLGNFYAILKHHLIKTILLLFLLLIILIIRRKHLHRPLKTKIIKTCLLIRSLCLSMILLTNCLKAMTLKMLAQLILLRVWYTYWDLKILKTHFWEAPFLIKREKYMITMAWLLLVKMFF